METLQELYALQEASGILYRLHFDMFVTGKRAGKTVLWHAYLYLRSQIDERYSSGELK